MIFGLEESSQTLFLYTIVLVLFFFVPQVYDTNIYHNVVSLKKNSFWSDSRMYFICAIFALVFGFRYDYMQDWSSYVRYYEYIMSGGLNDGWREPGFYIYVKILCKLGLNYYSMFFVECFIWIFSIFYLFRDHKNYLWFVLPLVFLKTSEAMVISRQYFAMSFLYIAYKNYFNRSKFYAILFAVAAFSLHYSILLWVCFFIIMKKVEGLSAKWIVVLFVLITIFSTIFASSLTSIASSLSIYLDSNGLGTSVYDSDSLGYYTRTGASIRQVLTLSISRGAYIWLYYKFKNNNFIVDKFINNLLIIGMVGMLIGVALGYNMIFSRFASYVTIFYNIGWGILTYIAYKQRRIIGSLYMYIALVVLFYLFGGFYSTLLSTFNLQDVNPFLIYDL